MIRNRLKEMMAERGLKAARMANDIDGLSRNTINSVANNNGKMIQFETIDLLCQYLGVQPSDFFEYLPFDVDVAVNSDQMSFFNADNDMKVDRFIIEPFYLNLFISKKRNTQIEGETTKRFSLSVYSSQQFKSSFEELPFDVQPMHLRVATSNPPASLSGNEFQKFWENDLTSGFRNVVQNVIAERVTSFIDGEFKNAGLDKPMFKPYIHFQFSDKVEEIDSLKNGLNVSYGVPTQTNDLPF